MAETPAVVIDNGSGVIKIGLSGYKTPCAMYPNIVGRPKERPVLIGAGQLDFYIGDEAQKHREILSIKYPIEHGVITSWDDMELLWKHAYRCSLKLNPSERPLLIREPALNPLSNREKMAEVFFENLDVPALYVTKQGILPLYATGKITGCVLNIGDGVTHSVPVYQGFAVPHAVVRLDVAGRDLTEYLMGIMRESGGSFVSSADKEIVKCIKEKLCYVAEDIHGEIRKRPQDLEAEYQLPDKNIVKIHSQRFRCPEALFTPAVIGIESPGIDGILYNSIMKCQVDLREIFFSNIVMSGGSSLFPGMHARLTKELTQRLPGECKVRVSAPPDPILAEWTGGSILASLDTFKNMWIKKAEYQEAGANILHKKHVAAFHHRGSE